MASTPSYDWTTTSQMKVLTNGQFIYFSFQLLFGTLEYVKGGWQMVTSGGDQGIKQKDKIMTTTLLSVLKAKSLLFLP